MANPIWLEQEGRTTLAGPRADRPRQLPRGQLMPATLPECVALVRYAQTVAPSAPMPAWTGNLTFDISVNAHQVPLDVAHQLLRTMDDLPWAVMRWPSIDDSGRTRYTLQIRGPHADVWFYTTSAGEPDDHHPIETGT